MFRSNFNWLRMRDFIGSITDPTRKELEWKRKSVRPFISLHDSSISSTTAFSSFFSFSLLRKRLENRKKKTKNKKAFHKHLKTAAAEAAAAVAGKSC